MAFKKPTPDPPKEHDPLDQWHKIPTKDRIYVRADPSLALVPNTNNETMTGLAMISLHRSEFGMWTLRICGLNSESGVSMSAEHILVDSSIREFLMKHGVPIHHDKPKKEGKK